LKHDIVVIGASAGGVEAIKELVSLLPPGLPAVILIVVHLSAERPSYMADIIAHAGPLPCASAQDGEPLIHGHIYVAQPGRHLLVEDGHLRLTMGPRENRARPAIDPLFRSAASTYGPRVVGVILTGLLDDGSYGLALIKAHGGVALVQDPDQALFAGMPRAAIAACAVDAVLPLKDLASRIVALATGKDRQLDSPAAGEQSIQAAPAEEAVTLEQQTRSDIHAQAENQLRSGQISIYVCPECGGTLWQEGEAGLIRFRCHTGHIYSPRTLLTEKARALEATLWGAVRLVTEKRTLTRQLAEALTAPEQQEQRAQMTAAEEIDAQTRQDLLALIERYPTLID
jgi:two-component system chemotaxis response regulator CheB